MRRINAITTIFIMLLFLVHLIWGALILMGLVKGGNQLFRFFSYTMMIFICIDRNKALVRHDTCN